MVSPLSAISVQRPFFCPFLYYGLPGQTMASLKETLTRLCTTGIEHLSVYGLIVEDGTPLQKMTEAGQIILPDEDEAADMYEFVQEFLKTQGFERYEISNYHPGIAVHFL